MSSRALRKLQREQEEQRKSQATDHQDDSAESESDVPPVPKVVNAFDMLQEGEEDTDGHIGTGDEDSAEEAQTPNPQRSLAQGSAQNSASKSSKKKKKNKKKVRREQETIRPPTNTQTELGAGQDMDEIDLALKSLATESKAGSAKQGDDSGIDEANETLCRLLAVESRHLNALNEMKRLFGNVVLEGEEDDAGTPRRRGRGPQQLDLGGALNARNSPVARGQGLAGLALRRNFFIQGKEEWPKGTGGGLGMEMVEKFDDGTVEYRFSHNTIYQDVQRQFEVCVESLDSQRMIQLLVYNPYHVSTLLQVSEIAKQQGDHSVSGDLLERALFTFGRSVHSSFTNAITQGRARLDFRRPENREFWLAAWRYMNNLGQRGTWRTAYEWAKLILSLDPEGDPYCISKTIDQLALRGGQPDHFVQLVRAASGYLSTVWNDRPNILMSLSLAEYRLKRSTECRQTLADNITLFPWLFPPLLSALDISPAPPSVWGKTPRTEAEAYETAHYVHCAKDLWNTPETTSLLMEVVSSSRTPPMRTPEPKPRPITLDEAREAFLLGVPSIINTIPRAFTSKASSNSDPYPPPENVISYDPSPSGGVPAAEYGLDEDEAELVAANPPQRQVDPRERSSMQGFFRRFFPWLESHTDTASAAEPEDSEIRALAARTTQDMRDAGVTQEEIEAQGSRLLELLSTRRQNEAPVEGQDATAAAVAERHWLASMLWGGRWPAEEAAGAARNEGEAATPGQDESEADHLPLTTSAGLDRPAESGVRPSSPTPVGPEAEAYDDAKNQRWLAGQGMLRLKELTAAHGTNPSTWPADANGQELLAEYVSRLRLLEREKSRRWILDSALRQGAGKDASEMVERQLNA